MNKIHNEENVPKQIKYDMKTYFYDETCQDYTDYDRTYGLFSDLLDKQYGIFSCLNDELEIIEEKEMCHNCHKYLAEYNQTYCEFCLGISKEEKKIPEKLETIEKFNIYDDSINWCCNGRAITDTEKDIMDKINEILDCFKSKGE